MKDQFLKAIDSCNTLEDFFKVCDQFYDIQNAKFNSLSRFAIKANVDKILGVTGAKLRATKKV